MPAQLLDVAAQLALVDALPGLSGSQRDPEEALAQLGLGRALLQSGDAAAAIAPLTRAVRLRESGDDPDSPWLAQARTALAQAQADAREAHFAANDSSPKRK